MIRAFLLLIRDLKFVNFIPKLIPSNKYVNYWVQYMYLGPLPLMQMPSSFDDRYLLSDSILYVLKQKGQNPKQKSFQSPDFQHN